MYLHSIELRLARAAPDYRDFLRFDALRVLHDCRENMLHNGKLLVSDLPAVIAPAAAFHEFYEGALGAYSTHTIFGADTSAGMRHVREVAAAIGWDDLCRLLDRTRQRLREFPAATLDDYVLSVSATEETQAILAALLVDDFADLVGQDVAEGHTMRRRAHDWARRRLDPALCDDAAAVPLLPGTVEAARERLGLTMQTPSVVDWRADLAAWRAERSPAAS